MKSTRITSPLGTVFIEGNAQGISKIWIEGEETAPVFTEIPEELEEAVNQLTAYFNGELKSFTFNLNPKGTAFQQKVWTALREIPYGKTISYSELSKKLGDAKAIRAVAAAIGKNPLWIAIPCHRVIGSDGSLTGYAGGLWRKKWLLGHESPLKQESLF